MILNWFKSQEVADIGAALADQFARETGASAVADAGKRTMAQDDALQEILRKMDDRIRPMRLNFYKRARFANAFRWRLIENGINGTTADHVTRALAVHLAMNGTSLAQQDEESAASTDRAPRPTNARQLLALGNKHIAQGAYDDAAAAYDDLLALDPRHVAARNNLAAALCKLGRFTEAEPHLREAIRLAPNFPDAHSNLGNLLRWKGQAAASEQFLRRALKLNPRMVDARINLGLTLAFMGRSREAIVQLEKALKAAPRNADALCGLAFVARTEGRFDEAGAYFKRVLDINPRMSNALAGQVGLRKMASTDNAWLERAEDLAKGELAPLDEAELRFAMGKFCDDIGSFRRAFENYRSANDLLKSMAEPYDRRARTSLVDDLIRTYTRESLAMKDTAPLSSAKPVLVVGMPRSGTSLTEQIIASHPAAKGAGELDFWGVAAQTHADAIREGRLDGAARKRIGEDYLRILDHHSSDALRVVDKAPINSDHLGLIYSIFPNARILYMQRDPIDTCLSCYFQQFSLAMGFAQDLSDLVHYYREHRRLMDHWRKALPPGSMMNIPYEELVADQAAWTRRILEFVGLEWDQRCLEFETTNRAVVTSSAWQVRQKIFKSSVMRWRNYEKFIGPLTGLRNLQP